MECRFGKCRTDKHHRYWPRRSYKTKLERTFRNLPENVVEICRCEHEELHATQQPPVKPTAKEMRVAINTRKR